MIRRTEKDHFLLIQQHDHAILAGELGKRYGNTQFEKPMRSPEVLTGIINHDIGWQKADSVGHLSAAGLPLDVFEAPRNVSHGAWLESARQATKIDLYAGLLVSLHVLSLSSLSVSTNQPSRFDVQQLKQQFELNKFQHAIIEHAESVRGRIGLTTNRPLRLGLADGWSDETEEMLKMDLRILQAMDLLSLSICCTQLPETKTMAIPIRIGGSAINLEITRPETGLLLIHPWPFQTSDFEVTVSGKIVPNKKYDSSTQLVDIIKQAEQERLTVVVKSR